MIFFFSAFLILFLTLSEQPPEVRATHKYLLLYFRAICFEGKYNQNTRTAIFCPRTNCAVVGEVMDHFAAFCARPPLYQAP